MCRFLLALCSLAAFVYADDTVCCFSDTFTMEGKFSLFYNASREGRRPMEMSATAEGQLASFADFKKNKFAAKYRFGGNLETAKDRKDEGEIDVVIILDASNSENPRLYAEAKGQVRNHFDKIHDIKRCVYGPIRRTDRIAAYKCVTQQIFKHASSPDKGHIQMQIPEEIPENIAKNLKIFFDQKTCTPSKISFQANLNHNVYVELKAEAKAKVDVEDMPDIPTDLEGCQEMKLSQRVPPADKVKNLLEFGLMMGGIGR